MTGWAAGCGWDIYVDDGYFYIFQGNVDALMFGGGVIVEEGCGIQGQERGVLPNEKSQTSPSVRAGSVPSDLGVALKFDRIGAGGQFCLLNTGDPDFVSGQKVLELVPRISDPVYVDLEKGGFDWGRVAGSCGAGW